MTGLRKLEYGTPTDKCGITVRLGIEKGIFEQEGFDLSVRVVFGGPQIAAAYNSGDLLLGEMGSPPAINAIAAGAAFKIIGSGCRQKAHMYFGVRRDIADFEGLRGKRIGMLGVGSCSDWVSRRILKHEGLDPDRDVELVPLLSDYARVIPLMEERRIDACLAVEPNVSIGESKGVLNVWAAAYDSPYLPKYQWVVLVAREDFIAREPETIRSFLAAYRRSARYAVDNPDEWAELAARLYGTDLETAKRSVARERPHYRLDCEIDWDGLQHAVELQHRLGAIPGLVDPHELANLSYMPGRVAAQ